MAANSEKLVKKAIKTIAEQMELDYDQLKSACKKIIKAARNTDEQLLGTMEELLDLKDVSSEEELVDFDIEVLKIYCKIKDIDPSGSEKSIRSRVWKNFEEEMEEFEDSDESDGSEPDSEPEPEPVVIKKKKSSSEKPIVE